MNKVMLIGNLAAEPELRLRTSEAAHPQIRALALELRDKLREALPVVFEDV